MAALNLPAIQTLSVDDARAMFEGFADSRRESYPSPPVDQVTDTTTGPDFGDIPVRIYRPNTDPAATAIVYFHGGGHVIGSLNSYDTVARTLTNTCNATVISVDYRMAPEHIFPAAPNGCFAATQWVVQNAETLQIDPTKIVVCGDSAGGNLATVVALMARDADLPIAAQILIYPVVDYRGGTPSFERYATGYGGLEAETVTWFMDHYLPDPKTRDDWRASPIQAASLENLPPALIITAECDVLHDEGAAYADALSAAGNTVTYKDYTGMIHGFFNYLGLADDAQDAHQTVADFLKRHV
jgi:acetyl esterase